MIALAYANGVIVFGPRVKPGTLPITKAPGRQLRALVSGLARHAYDGRTLLVPGLPEANGFEERSAALMRFKAEVEKRLGRPALARKIERWESRQRKQRAARRPA